MQQRGSQEEQQSQLALPFLINKFIDKRKGKWLNWS
jgi:hypothetical protein